MIGHASGLEKSGPIFRILKPMADFAYANPCTTRQSLARDGLIAKNKHQKLKLLPDLPKILTEDMALTGVEYS